MEHAVNRAFTTLSYGGQNTALYGDGKNHPGFGTTLDGKAAPGACISEPNSSFSFLARFQSIDDDLQSTLKTKPWLPAPFSQFRIIQI